MPLFSRYPTIRSWPEFLEFSAFGAPNHPKERVTTNVSYYAGNYLIIFVVLFIFTCLLNMMLLFAIIAVIGGGFAFKTYLKQKLAEAAQKSNTQRKKQIKENKQLATYYIYVSIVLIILLGNAPLASCIFLELVIVFGHALFRKRNFKSKTVHFMDIYQDFGPISSLADYIADLVEGNGD